MQDCDTLLVVGSAFPYSEFLPKPGSGPRRADRHRSDHAQSLRYPMEVNMVGDSAATPARAAAAAGAEDGRSPGGTDIESDVDQVVVEHCWRRGQ